MHTYTYSDPYPPPCIHIVVGVPPQFNSQQDDVVVFESNADGSNADLRLSCNVTGTPKPIVTWFMGEQPVDRELITDEGSLLIPNITEGEYASRTGVTYHCEATNIIGMTNITATIRSRDISVTYACKNNNMGSLPNVDVCLLPRINLC